MTYYIVNNKKHCRALSVDKTKILENDSPELHGYRRRRTINLLHAVRGVSYQGTIRLRSRSEGCSRRHTTTPIPPPPYDSNPRGPFINYFENKNQRAIPRSPLSYSSPRHAPKKNQSDGPVRPSSYRVRWWRRRYVYYIFHDDGALRLLYGWERPTSAASAVCVWPRRPAVVRSRVRAKTDGTAKDSRGSPFARDIESWSAGVMAPSKTDPRRKNSVVASPSHVPHSAFITS